VTAVYVNAQNGVVESLATRDAIFRVVSIRATVAQVLAENVGEKLPANRVQGLPVAR
jgi:hypothetical protein